MAAPYGRNRYIAPNLGLNSAVDLKRSGLADMLQGTNETERFKAKSGPNSFFQYDASLNQTGNLEVWKVADPAQYQQRQLDSRNLYSTVLDNIAISKQIYSKPTETTATATVKSLLNIQGK